MKKKNEETQMFNILPNDCQCDFCGKEPFKGYAGLRRHITHTPTCHKKSQQEFGLYAGGIWEDGLTIQQHLEGLKDTSTEHDLSQGTLGIEVENFGIHFDDDGIHGDDTPAASVNHIPQSSRPIFTSDLGNNKKIGHYIEDFDPESHAGAAWGQDTPVFESLCLKQEQASSHWDPFEDEEKWELAEWLVDNLGQKQTVMIFLILFCLPMSFHYF